jgi:Rrf2 family cysteine metabolism transcriptional repressor
MKFGVGVDYSLKALLMLADRYPSAQPLRVEEIAAVQGVPENYQKGPSGGYMLARSPARITMADVVEIIEGGYTPVECLEDGANSFCPRDGGCPMRDVWREVRDSVVGILRNATLQSLADRRKSAVMYQI